jgi:hypothetical protein
VDVGLQDVGDSHAQVIGQRQHPVDVTLGIDHHRCAGFADQIASVA